MSCSCYFSYVADTVRWPTAAVVHVLGLYGNPGIRLDLQLAGIPTEAGTQHVPTFPPAYDYRKWMDESRIWYLQSGDVTICVIVMIMQLEGNFKQFCHRSKLVAVLLLLRLLQEKATIRKLRKSSLHLTLFASRSETLRSVRCVRRLVQYGAL